MLMDFEEREKRRSECGGVSGLGSRVELRCSMMNGNCCGWPNNSGSCSVVWRLDSAAQQCRSV